MPNITVYLKEVDYVKLSNKASHMTKMSAAMLARIYIEKGLKDEAVS